MSLRAVVSTEFNFAMSVWLMYGAQTVPAYVSMGEMYILMMLILDLSGTGLLLFTIGNMIPRIAFVL